MRTLALIALPVACLLGGVDVVAGGYGEAPFVGKNAKVDGTDLFAFVSYEPGRAGYVTLIANYQPLQDSFAGPSYFAMDPDALYEIHVDNDGDAVEDLTFRFDFDSALAGGGDGLVLNVGGRDVAVAGVNIGAVSAANRGAQNHTETYRLQLVRGDRRSGVVSDVVDADTGAVEFFKPLDHIGEKSVPVYAAYADAHVFDVEIDGCTPPVGTAPRVFVGQRAEPTAMNLGQLHDLLNFDLDPATPAASPLGPQDQGQNRLGAKAVTSLALEVPVACLVDGSGTLGIWTSASVRQARVINPTATFERPTREGGPWAQVSRVGMPLVNDLVIGLPDKDRYNGSAPADDALFDDYLGFPTWPEIVELLFGAAGISAPNNFPRADLDAFFSAGFDGLNDGGDGEVLHLNTAIAPTPIAEQQALGALLCFTRGAGVAVFNDANAGCDAAGFPNGRRPGDDVVDVTWRALMGFFAPTGDAPAGGLPFVDGAFVAPTSFAATFPYLNAPAAGAP